MTPQPRTTRPRSPFVRCESCDRDLLPHYFATDSQGFSEICVRCAVQLARLVIHLNVLRMGHKHECEQARREVLKRLYDYTKAL